MLYFFRIEITGTNQISLDTFKVNFEDNFNPNEFYKPVEVSDVFNWNNDNNDPSFVQEYCYTCDLYLINENMINKYKGFVIGAYNGWTKEGMIKATIKKLVYDIGDWNNNNPTTPEIIWEKSK